KVRCLAVRHAVAHLDPGLLREAVMIPLSPPVAVVGYQSDFFCGGKHLILPGPAFGMDLAVASDEGRPGIDRPLVGEVYGGLHREHQHADGNRGSTDSAIVRHPLFVDREYIIAKARRLDEAVEV